LADLEEAAHMLWSVAVSIDLWGEREKDLRDNFIVKAGEEENGDFSD